MLINAYFLSFWAYQYTGLYNIFYVYVIIVADTGISVTVSYAFMKTKILFMIMSRPTYTHM